MATVLVVDDEATLRQMLKDVLENLGHTVLSATAPDEAIQICRDRQEPIHVMLTDLSLPIMNGVQLATHVKLLCPDMAIILMSAVPMLNDIDPNTLPPNTKLLKKPFDLTALEDMLSDL